MQRVGEGESALYGPSVAKIETELPRKGRDQRERINRGGKSEPKAT